MKRLFALILAMIMVWSMLPLGALAAKDETFPAAEPTAVIESTPETELETESETEPETESETKPVEVTELASAVESFEIPFTVNPIYEGIYTEADFPRREKADSVPGAPDHSDKDFWQDQELLYAANYLTIDAATKQLKQHMLNRDETFTLYFKAKTNDYNDHLAQMLTAAVAHTGKPKEGDYLQWHFAGWGGYVDYFWENGECCFVFEAQLAYSTTAAQEKELDTAVTKLLNSLNVSGKSEYQKIKAVYDYVCQNITYDYANLEDDMYLLKHSAYAALVNKTAVCQGYATLIYRLLLELGIDVRVIPGLDEQGLGHAWNIVRIGNVYYNLDATWDAGYEEYYWFLRNKWNYVYHYRYMEYETMEFHLAYPMALEDYVEGVAGEADPFIYAGYCGDEAVYVLSRNGEIYITGSGPMYDYTTSASNLPDWRYFWADHITSVAVDEGITRIGNYSFYALENLTTVVLATGIQEIGSYAFTRCYALTDVTIGEGLEKIGQYAFGSCSIAKIDLPDSLTEIDESAFSGGGLTEIVLPNNITEIKMMTFSGCNKLTKVELPDNLKVIGNGAFGQCYSLTEIYIPDGVTDLQYGVFSECSALTNIRLPDTLQSIGDRIFAECTSLAQVTLPENLTSIGASAFLLSGITDMVVPEGVTEIKKWTFARCPELKCVILPEGLISIGEEAFWCSEKLKTVNLPDSLTHIDDKAFSCCYALTDIAILVGITTYGSNIFGACTSLENVVLSEGLTKIGPSMFYSCTSLREIVLPNTMEAITYQCFGNCKSLAYITVPASVSSISDLAFVDCVALERITFEGNAPTFGTNTFSNVVATAYYPAGNETWTEETMQNYGGTITWVARCESHNFGNIEVVAPSCTEGGYTIYTCTACSDSYRTDETEKLGHDLPDWTVTVAATCTTDGSKTRTCQREDCDYNETEVIEASGHGHEAVVTAPTCTTGGYTTHTCSICGDSYVTDEVSAVGHSVAYGLTTAPTLDTEGALSGVCSVCAETLTQILPKLNKEDYTCTVLKAPTIEETGAAKYTWNVADYGEFAFEVVLEKLPPFVYGDTDGNGKIQTNDAKLVLQHIVRMPVELNLDAADVDGNGKIQTNDAKLILQYIVKIITQFPAEAK